MPVGRSRRGNNLGIVQRSLKGKGFFFCMKFYFGRVGRAGRADQGSAGHLDPHHEAVRQAPGTPPRGQCLDQRQAAAATAQAVFVCARCGNAAPALSVVADLEAHHIGGAVARYAAQRVPDGAYPWQTAFVTSSETTSVASSTTWGKPQSASCDATCRRADRAASATAGRIHVARSTVSTPTATAVARGAGKGGIFCLTGSRCDPGRPETVSGHAALRPRGDRERRGEAGGRRPGRAGRWSQPRRGLRPSVSTKRIVQQSSQIDTLARGFRQSPGRKKSEVMSDTGCERVIGARLLKDRSTILRLFRAPSRTGTPG